MKKKRKHNPPRIHIHIYRGVADRISSRGLRETVEVQIHDHDTQMLDDRPGYETSIYRLGTTSRKK